MEPEVIIEDWSPVCNIQAFVEKSRNAYYFYLWVRPGQEDAEIRTCWICNRVEAPKELDLSSMENGEAPSMPLESINHPKGGMELDASKLSIQWFEEGDAAALLSDGEILAVIPGFSGYKRFPGYSIYAEGTGAFAWGLKQAYSKFEAQLKGCRETWDFFETDFWGDVQDKNVDALNEFWNEYEKYYAIDGDQFPPKALLTGRKDGVVYAFTAGVGIIPMPKVEMEYQDAYLDYRRMELGFAVEEKEEQVLQGFLGVISSLAALPWNELSYLGHGHTIPFTGIDGYDFVLMLNNKVLGAAAPVYPDFRGEKVNLLWICPITAEQQSFIKEAGVSAFLEKNKGRKLHILGTE